MSDRILVVDDEAVLRDNLVRFLTRTGHLAAGAPTAEAALELLEAEDYAVVITDLRMPGMGGLALLEQLASRYPDVQVMVVTAYASVESAVEALRSGAHDYLLKPLSLDEVTAKVDRLLERRRLEQRLRRLRRELHGRFDTEGLVAESAEMKAVMQLVRKAASSRSSVLIEGESGTGKELIARALHDLSPWADKDFVAVNLAAQPRDLVDATLFGHQRGAYTGATHSRDGVFRAARGGTVFLDEVSELPLDVQVKLLRTLENREVLPLGADRAESVDFRLVAATNRSLKAMVDAGTFRQDLFFRLEVLHVRIPPLRDRPADIAPLVQRLLQKHSERQGRPVPHASNDVMRALEGHTWPGNVRELSNVLERAVLLCDGDTLELEDLPRAVVDSGTAPVDLKAAIAEFERRHIGRVLHQCGGDKTRAAEALGIHPATLYRHLERLR